MKEHIVIFSHGFGVRKDDRGLFSDISGALAQLKSTVDPWIVPLAKYREELVLGSYEGSIAWRKNRCQFGCSSHIFQLSRKGFQKIFSRKRKRFLIFATYNQNKCCSWNTKPESIGTIIRFVPCCVFRVP